MLAKVISDLLHKNLCKITEELVNQTTGKQKARAASVFAELQEAETPTGYEDNWKYVLNVQNVKFLYHQFM